MSVGFLSEKIYLSQLKSNIKLHTQFAFEFICFENEAAMLTPTIWVTYKLHNYVCITWILTRQSIRIKITFIVCHFLCFTVPRILKYNMGKTVETM